jgi:hypothetical protein
VDVDVEVDAVAVAVEAKVVVEVDVEAAATLGFFLGLGLLFELFEDDFFLATLVFVHESVDFSEVAAALFRLDPFPLELEVELRAL